VDAAQLDSIPLFAGLTLDQRESVAQVCEEIDVAPADTLLREGDFGYAMFAITAGNADVVQNGEVIRTLGPGDVLGEVAVLAGGRRTATVVATTPMKPVTVFNRDLWKLEQDLPEVATVLRSKVAAHVGAAGDA